MATKAHNLGYLPQEGKPESCSFSQLLGKTQAIAVSTQKN